MSGRIDLGELRDYATVKRYAADEGDRVVTVAAVELLALVEAAEAALGERAARKATAAAWNTARGERRPGAAYAADRRWSTANDRLSAALAPFGADT